MNTNTNVVLLNILGILRWATPNPNGTWDVESTFHNGTQYMAYNTHGGKVVWDVDKAGRYPTAKEFAELEN